MTISLVLFIIFMSCRSLRRFLLLWFHSFILINIWRLICLLIWIGSESLICKVSIWMLRMRLLNESLWIWWSRLLNSVLVGSMFLKMFNFIKNISHFPWCLLQQCTFFYHLSFEYLFLGFLKYFLMEIHLRWFLECLSLIIDLLL